MYQHPSDWENGEGIIRQADAHGMGIVLMRPMTSGVFQRLMAETFPELDTLDVGRLLLNDILCAPYVDAAPVRGRVPRHRQPRLKEPSIISVDVVSRINLAALHRRYSRVGTRRHSCTSPTAGPHAPPRAARD